MGFLWRKSLNSYYESYLYQSCPKELVDAIAYYELEFSGLGTKFKEEIKKSITRIIEHPKAWSVERREIRRALLHRFPYKILYSIEKDHILIIAIAHQHRKPDYWV